LAGAMREYKRAIELNPNDATAHHLVRQRYLAALGRFEEAIAEGKRAIELDPLSTVINVDLGETLYYAHRYDEAERQCEKPSRSIRHLSTRTIIWASSFN